MKTKEQKAVESVCLIRKFSDSEWSAARYNAEEEKVKLAQRLLDAAPELLEALKNLYSHWREYADLPNDFWDINEKIEAAIAKAEGKSK